MAMPTNQKPALGNCAESVLTNTIDIQSVKETRYNVEYKGAITANYPK
jgi:hypothetical protein